MIFYIRNREINISTLGEFLYVLRDISKKFRLFLMYLNYSYFFSYENNIDFNISQENNGRKLIIFYSSLYRFSLGGLVKINFSANFDNIPLTTNITTVSYDRNVGKLGSDLLLKNEIETKIREFLNATNNKLFSDESLLGLYNWIKNLNENLSKKYDNFQRISEACVEFLDKENENN